jgi:hypothetical protein
MAAFTRNPAGTVPIRVEQDSISVDWWGPERDPQWRHVDAAGHGHFYDDGYPTLHEVTETMGDPDDGDEWQAHVRWECPHCGEHIEPGTRQSMGTRAVPGMKRYFVDDQEVDRETFLVAWREIETQRMAEREAGI